MKTIHENCKLTNDLRMLRSSETASRLLADLFGGTSASDTRMPPVGLWGRETLT